MSSAHFSGPPAMPTTRAPSAFASCPATDPTAPAAAETTTVSPAAGLRDPADPHPRGQAGHPEHAEVGARRDAGDLGNGQHRRLVGSDEPLLPADEPLDELALLVRGMVGGDHAADPGGADDLADRDRRQVGRRVVEPGPVGRVDRDVLGPDQRLALADLGDRLGDELERVGIDALLRALAKQVAAVALGHRSSSGGVSRPRLSGPRRRALSGRAAAAAGPACGSPLRRSRRGPRRRSGGCP